ncbi:hypothetical protein GGP80_000837 [Salinibacter ruber]|jgi:hypothetical protein|nr:hypothetical protein [Salinibacter ruber]MBB4061628.1 hypothetical protein [Salinibacter ruber]MCS3627739.1 hypothetical protein [Salinibacter ruber]MCS3635223.1 hypothetical protein [Salinibacter ruber]MCS3637840.1 hypothetical protein [Salinibacter ruber]MCS3659809.1 hypothetical protein [Salinibacter ruber]
MSTLARFAHTLRYELFENTPPDTKGRRLFFRGLELFIMGYAVYFCWTWGVYIQQNISSVLLPLGLANYIDVSFMFDHNVALINAVLVGMLGLVGFFRLWRPAYLLALLAFHLQYVARYSLGEISHGSNLIGMGVLGLGLALVVFQGERQRRRFTFGFLYFFIGLGYTSAAVCKLIGTGITWPDGRHLLMWIGERKVDTLSRFGSFDATMLQDLVFYDYHFGTLILLVGLLTEAVSFLMWWGKYRYLVVMLVVGMHFGILFSMNIFFQASTILLILLGLPWHRLIDYGLDRAPATVASS